MTKFKSIDPAIWGPAGWTIVHSVAAFAAKDPSVMAIFPHFFVLLPCPACQKNYQRHLQDLPIPKDPKKMLRWSFDLHQRVNGWKHKRVDLAFSDMQHVWKNRTLAWNDVWVFLEALLNSHAGATHVTKQYIEELTLFFATLKKLLPMRTVSVDELIYKVRFRMLLQELKKVHHITVKTPVFSCSSEVCNMDL